MYKYIIWQVMYHICTIFLKKSKLARDQSFRRVLILLVWGIHDCLVFIPLFFMAFSYGCIIKLWASFCNSFAFIFVVSEGQTTKRTHSYNNVFKLIYESFSTSWIGSQKECLNRSRGKYCIPSRKFRDTTRIFRIVSIQRYDVIQLDLRLTSWTVAEFYCFLNTNLIVIWSCKTSYITYDSQEMKQQSLDSHNDKS